MSSAHMERRLVVCVSGAAKDGAVDREFASPVGENTRFDAFERPTARFAQVGEGG